MSDSHKHKPIIKYAGDTSLKRTYNRSIRRKYGRVDLRIDPDEDMGPQGGMWYRRLNEPYDIADVRDYMPLSAWVMHNGSGEEGYREWQKMYRAK